MVTEAAAAFLAVRSRSVAETRRRLRHLGYRDAVIGVVIDRLIGMHYLDDRSFARWWVESRDRSRPRGESALRRELALKGVAREVVDAALAERAEPAQEAWGSVDRPTGGADDAAARRLLERRRASLEREPDPRKRRQKAYALLARNGFGPETCSEVSRAMVADWPGGDESPS